MIPENLHISPMLTYTWALIFGVLLICSIAFWLLSKFKPSKLALELITRTNSWWSIAIGVGVVTVAPPIVGAVIIGYISFIALREMLSIAGFRPADRGALFAAYLSIPVQYYLAYHGMIPQVFYFIPLAMFLGLPFILVLAGKIKRIGTSMSLIPSLIILTVYTLSHIVLLFNLDIPNYTVGAGGLIIYLIILTEFNDVFQFTWGKLFGKHKILPVVSPNKTWEGFIGGVLSTTVLSFLIRILTPLSGQEALIMGFCLSIIGFMGDAVISGIKRDLHIKDTDDLIPGHGGAMDRLDSIVFTAPCFYHLLTYFIQH